VPELLTAVVGLLHSELVTHRHFRCERAIEELLPAGVRDDRLVALFTDNPRRALGLDA
jgi:hypothetical protein